MSGYQHSSGLARNVFTSSESTDSSKESKIYKKSLVVRTPLWTHFVKFLPAFLFVNMAENPKAIHIIPDVQAYRPFLTKHNWSLERIFCRPEPSRYISIVQGSGALTQGQLRSSVICSFLSIFMICLIITGLLVWLGLGTGPITLFLLICIGLLWSSLRNTFTLIKLGRDLFDARNIKENKYEEKCNPKTKSDDGGEGGDEEQAKPCDSTVTLESSVCRKDESEAVYHITKLERLYQATDLMCWISFVVEVALFFLYPAIALFVIGDSSLGGVFVVLSVISNVRWYMNIVTAVEETGVSCR